MEIELVIIAAILLVILFLATIDMAISRLSDVSLRRLASDVDDSENRAGAELFRAILDSRPRFRFVFSTTIQVLLVIYSIVLTFVVVHLGRDSSRLMLISLAIGLVSTTIFRQILPGLIVAKKADQKLLFLLPIVRPFFVALSWLTRPFENRMTAKERLKLELTTSPETYDERIDDASDDFQALMEVGAAEGIIEQKEREMIETFIDFSDTRVDEIMTPRTEICALPFTSTVKEARDRIVDEKYSRLPVYRDSIDNIEGMIYVRDLLQAWAEGKEIVEVSTIMRDAFFVPETKTASELLKTMQLNHVQVAIVIDEYGGVAGLVTVEDILEELVGEIEDEDTEQEEIVEMVAGDDGYWDVIGSTEIDKIERLFDADLEDEDYSTIAGLVTSEAGYVPKIGERLLLRGLSVEIIKADEKKLHLIRLRRIDEPEEDDFEDR